MTAAASRPYEVQHEPAQAVAVLREIASTIGGTGVDVHAVTMTAELSQMFRFKRDGVVWVLEAIERAFPHADIAVYAAPGHFVTLASARLQPLSVAAANWIATATLVARWVETAMLIDIGTTTTDIIPLVGGGVAATGWTDPDRLASGELLYLGAVRTPVEAIVQSVPFRGVSTGVSAEAFALAGDVHHWRGSLRAADYTARTPDAREVTRAACGERLARVICGDREILEDGDIDAIAEHVAEAQIARTAECIARVHASHPTIARAVVAGIGHVIASEAARRAGLRVLSLADDIGNAAAHSAPAAAVALLRAEMLVSPITSGARTVIAKRLS